MKTIKLFAAGALILGALASPLAAPALANGTNAQDTNGPLLDFCYGLIESGNFPDLNLGECMAFNLTPDPGFKALFCDYLRETGQLEEAGVTYSQCIRGN